MPTSYKVLGQEAVAATTQTDLYTSPAATETIVSTINVSNRSSSATATYRIAVRPAGESILNKHYLVFDSLIGVSDSIALTIGVTLAPTDVLTVYSSTANLTFSAFGSQITA
jgi:hypothetical protein